MIHLYAIVEELDAEPRGRGVDDAFLECRRVAGLDAIVSVHDEAVEPLEEAVLPHAKVVEWALARASSIVPARFTGGFPDDDALEAGIAARREELFGILSRVRGCVELGVRILAPARTDGDTPADGGAYMRALLGKLRAAETLADDLHHTLAEAARESGRADAGAGGFLLSSVYLVPRDDVGAFRARVRSLQEAHPELGVVCTGPWPPYSFAALDASADVSA